MMHYSLYIANMSEENFTRLKPNINIFYLMFVFNIISLISVSFFTFDFQRTCLHQLQLVYSKCVNLNMSCFCWNTWPGFSLS